MGRTILLIDDDRALQEATAAILEDEGYAVVSAFDGLDALEKLDRQRPDLILLDMGMPVMDGFAFAAELTRRALEPAIPIVVLTADGSAPQKARRIGAAGFLAKPFQLDDLLDRVGGLLPPPQAPAAQ